MLVAGSPQEHTGSAGLGEPLRSPREDPSKGLIVVAVAGPVPKHFADVTVRPLLAAAAPVCGMWGVLGHLCLRGAVLCVVQIEAIADVTEETWLLFGQFFLVIAVKGNVPVSGMS